MTSELIALIDRLESEHVDVLHALKMVRPAVEDHDGVALQEALEAGGEEFGTALNLHIEAEDGDLFPQIAEMIGAGMVSVFVDEHVQIKALRDKVYERMAQGGTDFDGCAELCELLADHMQREDQVLFPAARGVLAD
jgi:hemerythrin-like domain-containing protein